jgi:hypothetical protein
MNASELAALDLPTAVEHLAAPAYVISRGGRFSWVNRAMIELLGDLRGEPFVEYVAPEHRQLARANFTRKVVGKTTKIFEMDEIARNHIRALLRAMGAHSRLEAVLMGLRAGVISANSAHSEHSNPPQPQ